MRVLILLAGLLTALPSFAAAQATADFREWWTACDEQRTCWAFGFAEDGADTLAFVRVERGGAAGAQPAVILAAGIWGEAVKSGTARMRVLVDGAPATELTARAGKDENYYVAVVDDGKAARGLITALRNGRELRLQVDGLNAPAVVSLDGAAAALLWVDDRQKRVGTPTALTRQGSRPLSTIPPVPPVRVVRAAKPVAQGRLPTAFPRFILQQPEVRECLAEVYSDDFKKPQVARLDAKTLLWGVTCAQGAYQTSEMYFLADAQGRGWTRAPFDPPPPAGEDQWVTNGGFDPKTMSIGAFAKGRGLGDCGTGSEWVWDGRAFVLVSETTMVHCRGVPWEYWPETVKRRVVR